MNQETKSKLMSELASLGGKARWENVSKKKRSEQMRSVRKGAAKARHAKAEGAK